MKNMKWMSNKICTDNNEDTVANAKNSQWEVYIFVMLLFLIIPWLQYYDWMFDVWPNATKQHFNSCNVIR